MIEFFEFSCEGKDFWLNLNAISCVTKISESSLTVKLIDNSTFLVDGELADQLQLILIRLSINNLAD